SMNKLRKPRPAEPYRPMTAALSTTPSNQTMSRTMQLAVTGLSTKPTQSRDGNADSTSANLQRTGTWFSAPLAAAPRTKVEQYWAARALVAETLLSARVQHQGELTGMRLAEEEKRAVKDIAALVDANDQRHRRLERFVAIIVACLVVLLGFIVYVVMIAPDYTGKRKPSPSHFTIPILSPFTSVVEHETGVFGTKAVTLFVLVIGVILYTVLRRQLARCQQDSSQASETRLSLTNKFGPRAALVNGVWRPAGSWRNQTVLEPVRHYQARMQTMRHGTLRAISAASPCGHEER
ncbi:hypothetical protein BU15DRAFT_47193, partial [Melanogaster broomeanus]